MKNPYKPYPVQIEKIKTETDDKTLKTFTFAFKNSENEKEFSYIPGQFAMLSIHGVGEIPIGIASSPTEKGILKFTVFRTGKVTNFLHTMKPGQEMGVRGPFGNGFPLNQMQGKNILVIGGGFAFTTLRSFIKTALEPENRDLYKNIDLVYGARNPGMLLYRDEIEAWNKRDDIRMHITVDNSDDTKWPYHTGFVPAIVQECAPKCEKSTMALVCGPPVMIKFTRPVLKDLGYADTDIIMSLENRMKCGIGMCGRCNIGKELVCKDGPVFSLDRLNLTPKEF